MTTGQASAYQTMMPTYGIEFANQVIDLRELFGNDNPVTIEIGFGMGTSLALQAEKDPQHNFLGIEVHRPGVGSLLARMQESGLTNIRVLPRDAVEVLEHMLADDCLQRAQLFFPDPWHKRRHHKRRIVKPEFVQRIHQKLKVGGVFHMATDWENYAAHMLAVMQAEKGWKNLSTRDDYVPKPSERPITKFQKRGEKLGHGVWDLMFTKENV